ncbi:uncharacterized protein I206_102963 [Kwoniella pini CBS 10737]|uniref:BTB domain-containing protein n=1 Tax=Kwoniella pini CBS 10737 TaxID=1296096 RepID=A0A1B9I6T9_9TREE|nr:uncharacterized protein I206_03315 [Kwoniella pini CBS 10737]OCF51248.1 hypothetical protein I206_03315 [Kwoniella pini CBS 10737]
MSTTYTTKSGKEYEYYEKFNDTSKNLVLVSSDNLALRVDCTILRTSSSVFRSMFATCDTEGDQVHLPHTAELLGLYIFALDDRHLDLSNITYETFQELLEICIRYDTLSIGPQLFRKLTKIQEFDYTNGYELVVLAAKFDDILTACRIISKIGYEAYGRNSADKFWKTNNWERDIMNKLPST